MREEGREKEGKKRIEEDINRGKKTGEQKEVKRITNK